MSNVTQKCNRNKCSTKERRNLVVWRFLKGEKMENQMQDIINDLESLQFDILFQKRKEKNRAKQKLMADQANFIDRIIDKIYAMND